MADAPPTDPAALTRYIALHYHGCDREKLPALTRMTQQVETIHFNDNHLPAGLSDVVAQMLCMLDRAKLVGRLL